jgi:hypothetical protein
MGRVFAHDGVVRSPLDGQKKTPGSNNRGAQSEKWRGPHAVSSVSERDMSVSRRAIETTKNST